MITNRPDIDIAHLGLEGESDEIEYWRNHDPENFLCLVSENDGEIDGYLIGWKFKNYLWINQIWHKSGTSLESSKKGLAIAKVWAKERGMTHMRGETTRKEMRALKRYGFEEMAVILKCEL